MSRSWKLPKTAIAIVLAAGPLVAGPATTLAVAPGNDDFANAQVLGAPLPITAAGSNVDATAESGEPSHGGQPAAHSAWYAWTAPASARVVIDLCDGPLSANLGVYTGASVDGLTAVGDALHLAGCAGFGGGVRLDAEAGTTYHIAVDGYAGDQDAFELSIRASDPPANDDFASAQPLSGALPITAAGANVDATKEPSEPNHAGDNGGSSIWYTWTAPATATVLIDHCDADFGAVLAVYTGPALGSLTHVASRPDVFGCDPLPIAATAGTTYRIAVDGTNDLLGLNQGSIDLVIRAPEPPPNDAFADATVIDPVIPVVVSGTNVDASKEPGEPSHAGVAGGASVWFTWTAPVTNSITINTCGSDFDTLLAVYLGDDVAALTEVASNDDAPGNLCNYKSLVTFDGVAGTTYRIAVDGFFDATIGGMGSIELEIETRPANDDFAEAELLEGPLPISASGNNFHATKETGEPNHADNQGGASVWYSWTPDTSGLVSVDTCGSDVDNVVAVYTGDALDELVEIASQHGASCYPGSLVTFAAAAGTTYRIAVDGWYGTVVPGLTRGPYELHIGDPVLPPANDDFADAIALSGELPITASGETFVATKEPGEPDHAGNAGGASVWYSWTPATSQQVAIDTCGSGFDTVLGVYTGDLGALAEVASNDDGPLVGAFCNLTSLVVIDAVAGTTYHIAIDGFDGQEGGLEVRVRLPGAPANDDFANAQVLTGAIPLSVPGSTIEATREDGEPEHAGLEGGRSVWYAWTAPATEETQVNTCESGFDTVLAVYTGGSLAGLTPIASNDDHPACGSGSVVTFDAIAGTDYAIAVDGYAGGPFGAAVGDFTLALGPSAAPANDDFADAHVVDGALPSATPGSTPFATKEPGEPNHAGNAGGASVWFSWTAEHPMPVIVDTCAADFDTLLAVYTGDAVGELDLVAGNDDAPACGPASAVAFDAIGGQTYHIAVDGFDQFGAIQTGEFELTIRSACTLTINGDHAGLLTVAEGIACLDGASVSGPVRVRAGASLWSNGSDIAGPVSSSGSARVVLCSTTVSGPVRLEGASSVTLGDPDLGCAPNTIIGPVTVRDTAGPSVIAGNLITGSLACTGNVPPPVDHGVPNLVSGPAKGQCAVLAT